MAVPPLVCNHNLLQLYVISFQSQPSQFISGFGQEKGTPGSTTPYVQPEEQIGKLGKSWALAKIHMHLFVVSVHFADHVPVVGAKGTVAIYTICTRRGQHSCLLDTTQLISIIRCA